MKMNPYTVSTVTHSKHQLIDSETNEVVATFCDLTDAVRIADRMNAKVLSTYRSSMNTGFDMGTQRAADLIEQHRMDVVSRSESDTARPPHKLSEHAQRVNKEHRRAEGGGA